MKRVTFSWQRIPFKGVEILSSLAWKKLPRQLWAIKIMASCYHLPHLTFDYSS